jgi:hypothetical protein
MVARLLAVGNPAGRLYDKFAQADDFVRYRLLLQ